MVPEAGDPDDRAMALRTASQSDGKLALLAEVPPFHSWRHRELIDLGRQVELLEVPAGTVLQRQGEPVGQWLVVVDGSVLRLRDRTPVALLPAGSTWGEALLSRDPGQGHASSPETLVCLETTTALVADPRRWRSLLSEHPVLGSGWTVPSYDEVEDVTGDGDSEVKGRPQRVRILRPPTPCTSADRTGPVPG